MNRTIYSIIAALLVLAAFATVRGNAATQTGMTKETAKVLVTDLIEAGFSPTIREEGGVFFITVHVELNRAPTAQQVHNFATNRSVTARIMTVQFQ